jgi:hypothetical protein
MDVFWRIVIRTKCCGNRATLSGYGQAGQPILYQVLIGTLVCNGMPGQNLETL